MANDKSTQLWFAKARDDLKVAKALDVNQKEFFAAIVFHAQQAAEKSIKAFLTFNNIRVLKTHDISKLLFELSQLKADLAVQFEPAKTLTLYAVEYRYPDATTHLPQLTFNKVVESIKLAEHIFDSLSTIVRQQLPFDL